MSWVHNQGTGNFAHATSVAAAFGSAVSAGDVILAPVVANNTPTSVLDTLLNSYALIGSATSGTCTIFLYWIQTPTAGTPTITASFSSTTFATIGIDDYTYSPAGTASLTGHNTGGGTGTLGSTRAITVATPALTYAAFGLSTAGGAVTPGGASASGIRSITARASISACPRPTWSMT